MVERKIRSAVVTGPTGAIGTALCRKLAEQGITVYAVHRPNSDRAQSIPAHENIHRVSCDLADISTLPTLVKSADVFFHLGWMYTIGPGRNDAAAQNQNVAFALDAVRAAHALGCRVFLGAGSQAEYGRHDGPLTGNTPCAPENAYGAAKLLAGSVTRKLANELGMDHVWVRILSVYGPDDSHLTMISGVIRQLLAGDKPPLTSGTQIWDYLYSTDAADGLLLAALKGRSGKTYPLGSGEARPLLEYITDLRDAINPNLPLGFGEIPFGPQQVMHLQADISDLTADTGFLPRVAFADGIRLTIESFKGN